jgi:Rrf2 family protein
MLRLSTKGQYGVRAMYEIAKGYPHQPVTIKEISERQNVSAQYLEQILNKLRKANLIRSIKGPGGGYILNKDPKDISIASILNELEGPVALTSCLEPEKSCIMIDKCVVHLLWKALGEQIEGFLKTITLKNLINENLNEKGTVNFGTIVSKNRKNNINLNYLRNSGLSNLG